MTITILNEDEIVAVKVALREEQVRALRLPPQMKAKETSSRCKKFVQKYGEDVYELEAVPPVELQSILREAIDSVIDVDAFNAEIEREKQDAADLERIRQRLMSRLGDIDGIG